MSLQLFALVALLLLLVALPFIKKRTTRNRERELRSKAEILGFDFVAQRLPKLDYPFDEINLLQRGDRRQIRNVYRRKTDDINILLFDFYSVEGYGRSAISSATTVIAFCAPGMQFPHCTLQPESPLHKLGSLFGRMDIDFDSHPKFSRLYLLRGDDEAAIRALFGARELAFFEKHWDVYMETNGSTLLCYSADQPITMELLKDFFQLSMKVFNLFYKP